MCPNKEYNVALLNKRKHKHDFSIRQGTSVI